MDDYEHQVRRHKHVWKDTRRYLEKFENTKSELIKDIDDDLSTHNIKIFILENDPLDIAEFLCKKNTKPLIVSNINQEPSLALKNGIINSEYNLYRRTSLKGCINEDQFPITGTNCLYSPDVFLFKNNNFDLIKKCAVSVVSISLVTNPSIISMSGDTGLIEEYENKRDEERMKELMEKICLIANENNHDCLIIDDFGCELGNPYCSIIKFIKTAVNKFGPRYVFICLNEKTKITGRKFSEAFYA